MVDSHNQMEMSPLMMMMHLMMMTRRNGSMLALCQCCQCQRVDAELGDVRCVGACSVLHQLLVCCVLCGCMQHSKNACRFNMSKWVGKQRVCKRPASQKQSLDPDRSTNVTDKTTMTLILNITSMAQNLRPS